MESYSRVLESLAFNILARIDDLLYVDDLTKHSDTFSPMSKVGMIAHKSVSVPYSVPITGTPYKTAFSTPSFSPAQLVSPAKGDRSPFRAGNKVFQNGLGVKKVLTDYLNMDGPIKDCRNSVDGVDSILNKIQEASPSRTGTESLGSPKPPARSPLRIPLVGRNE